MIENNALLKRVSEIYEWLDSKINESPHFTGFCQACGACCDFVRFDHRLFVTTPELVYFSANLGSDCIKPMLMGRCPYNESGKCAVYQYRFAACRIFYCKGNAEFQSELSEWVLKEFKSICTEFGIDYCYRNLSEALSSFTGD